MCTGSGGEDGALRRLLGKENSCNVFLGTGSGGRGGGIYGSVCSAGGIDGDDPALPKDARRCAKVTTKIIAGQQNDCCLAQPWRFLAPGK